MDFLGDKRSMFRQLMAVAFAAVFASCNPADQKPVVRQNTVLAKPGMMQPFRFHKTIEISPGNVFDIFSWGRGSAETGSFLILKSDSAEVKYTTTTGDLNGTITDVYNTDMDMDGNPEILIQAKSKDSTVRTQIYAFEYKDDKAQKLDFPKLTSSQKKGYRGEDKFYIKEGVLMREFPVFDGNNAAAKVTDDKRILEYGIHNNSFTVKTISQENENKTQTAATDSTKKTPVKEASTTKQTSTKNTSKKKHHVEERRHHSSKKTAHKRSSSSHASKKHRRHRR